MKNIKYLLFMIFVFVIFSNSVFAANVTVNSNKRSVTRGGYVSVSVTVSANDGIYTIDGSLICSGAGSGQFVLKYEDLDTANLSWTSSAFQVKADSVGKINCSTSGVFIRELGNSSKYSLSDASISIDVTEPAKIPPKTYSSNNNLSGLGVEGYNLTPEFSKDTLEYSLEVPNEVEKVNVVAKTEDDKARVEGAGEVTVSEGNNRLEVKVIAENGNEKIYVINLKVKELNPIKVKIDNKDEGTVVRKREDLPKLELFEESKVVINGEEVVSYFNKKLGIQVVGIKDNNGKVKLYTYDSKVKKFEEYNQIVVGNIVLYLRDGKLPDSNYQKYVDTIDEIKVDIYKLDKSDKVGLLYGINVVTGNEGYYSYDKEENSLQRYFDKEIEVYQDTSQKYFIALMVSLGVITIYIIVMLIRMIIKKRNSKKIVKEIKPVNRHKK